MYHAMDQLMPRPVTLWMRVRTSLWFLPTTCSATAVALAFLMVWIDRYHAPPFVNDFWFVFQTGAEGARGVLSTIAGSLMTVTGVVFSITIVVLQLASSQFTPRVLRTFTEDRANHLVLGVFIGTFIYSLLVMRSVRSSSDDYGGFVPALSVTVAVVLALLSIAVLIFFVHHVAHSIRVEIIMQRVTDDAIEVVDELFPKEIADASDRVVPQEWSPPQHEVVAIQVTRSGYIQAFDDARLLSVLQRDQATVILERAIGDFVVVGDVIARAWPAHDGRTAEAVGRAFKIGPERTRHQDVERGIIELADIGIRALSPSVNDPSTAIVCIDRLSEVLIRLGTREFPALQRVSSDDSVRIQTKAPGFDELVRLAYRELRHHGAQNPAVSLRLIAALAHVAARVPPSRRSALRVEVEETVNSAAAQLQSDYDVERVRAASDEASRLLEALS